MVIPALILIGLALGSFINALVWRLKNNLSISKGRSMCVHCRHSLAWYDLIPVISWLLLIGKCRYCKQPISWQYPLVELATAILFVFSYLAWSRDLAGGVELSYFGLWLVALVLMIALTVYDFRWMELPDKLVWPFVLTGFISIAILGTQDDTFVLNHLFGAAAAWGFFALIYYGSKGQWMGGGDVKFSLGMGTWLGIGNTFVGILTAFYSASIVIIPLLLFKIVKRKQPIPFGPFLIAGTVIAMLWGQDIISWYKDAFLPQGF